MYKRRAFIFDFDYTLADSSKGVVSCINYALDEMGIAAVCAEEACRTIGLSLPNTFHRLCGGEMPHRADEFARLFVKHADKVMTDLTELYDDVPETMRILKGSGFKLGIVSSKFRYRIEQILQKSLLNNVFDVIIGGEDVTNHKPHSEGIIKAIRRLNVEHDETIYVGDSITDAQTVSDLDIKFIAALTGVTGKEEFTGYNVFKFIDCISELKDFSVCL